ncbi:MAG TPA: hypothetical protein P5218_10820, partial [Planctomycetota bacterium]|nr:hypothetical protein [Planctomycetota bacterium]
MMRVFCLGVAAWMTLLSWAPALSAQDLDAKQVVSNLLLEDRGPLEQLDWVLKVLNETPASPFALDLLESVGELPYGSDEDSLLQTLLRLREKLQDVRAQAWIGDW